MAHSTNGVSEIQTDAVVTNTTKHGSPQRAILPQSMTPEEIALYDRQIRLWGMKAQSRLRNAKVLLINVRGLGAEIAKNLTLAGIQNLTLMDGATVKAQDLGANFLLSNGKPVGQNRAQASAQFLWDMNPRVSIATDPRHISQVPSLDSIFAIFDLVIATDLHFQDIKMVSESARRCNKPLYIAESVGLMGYAFADLISHEFTIERAQSNVASRIGFQESPTRLILATTLDKVSSGTGKTETVTKREIYSTFADAAFAPLPTSESSSRRKLKIPGLLSCIRALWRFQSAHGPGHPFPVAEHGAVVGRDTDGLARSLKGGNRDCEELLRLAQKEHAELGLPPHTLNKDKVADFINYCGTELIPVCAIIGGNVAQDAINVLSGKEQPIQNLLLFDADDTVGAILPMHPPDFGLKNEAPPTSEANGA